MTRRLRQSLLQRVGLMMGTITALAIMGMTVSVFMAERLEGQAGAVNQAGSLRMQAYRVLAAALASQVAEPRRDPRWVTQAQIEFEDRLASPRLVEMLPQEADSPVRVAYDRVVMEWRRNNVPLIQAFLAEIEGGKRAGPGSSARTRERTILGIEQFVARVDHLTQALEDDAEYRVRLLRMLQGASLLLTVAIVALTMLYMRRNVVEPLSDLLRCAGAARSGDFSVRAAHAGEDELGRLGHAFNLMAADLSKLYTGLEERVEEKTAALRRSNLSLKLLYRASRRLSEGSIGPSSYADLLTDIEQVLGVEHGAICISPDGRPVGSIQASDFPGAGGRPPGCSPSRCPTCMQIGHAQAGSVEVSVTSGQRLLVAPLKDRKQTYGALVLEVSPGGWAVPWQLQLLDAVGQHIGLAIGTARRAIEDRRVALLDERMAIARELHDSLAQSLSYLKIQLSRLQRTLGASPNSDAHSVLTELREGVREAYRQLRELITTFRVQMNGRGLAYALEDTVTEFGQRTNVKLILDNRLEDCPLSANAEIHVLQVVREALANVIRHARASHAEVKLERGSDRRVDVTIADDGIGIGAETERRYHFGRAIMQERARSLGGTLSISRRPEGGTLVALSFVANSQQADEQNAADARQAQLPLPERGPSDGPMEEQGEGQGRPGG